MHLDVGGGARFRQSQTFQNYAYQDAGSHIQVGWNTGLGNSRLRFGVGGSYEQVVTSTNGASGRGDRYQLGLSLGYSGTAVEGAVYGTFGNAGIATTRPVFGPAGPVTAMAQQRFNFGQLGGDLHYRFDLGGVSVRPGVDGGYAYYEQQRTIEQGAGVLSLAVGNAGTKGFGFVRPNVDLSSGFDLGKSRIQVSVSGAICAALAMSASPRPSTALRRGDPVPDPVLPRPTGRHGRCPPVGYAGPWSDRGGELWGRIWRAHHAAQLDGAPERSLLIECRPSMGGNRNSHEGCVEPTWQAGQGADTDGG